MKNKIKSELGITMTDLIVGLLIFTVFTVFIGSLFYSTFKTNMQVKLSGATVNYAMLILEDIDKIAYDEVKNEMESEYISKFSIPESFDVKIEVTRYNEDYIKEDLIKMVKLTISYEFAGESENFIIEKLKVRELNVD